MPKTENDGLSIKASFKQKLHGFWLLSLRQNGNKLLY